MRLVAMVALFLAPVLAVRAAVMRWMPDDPRWAPLGVAALLASVVCGGLLVAVVTHDDGGQARVARLDDTLLVVTVQWGRGGHHARCAALRVTDGALTGWGCPGGGRLEDVDAAWSDGLLTEVEDELVLADPRTLAVRATGDAVLGWAAGELGVPEVRRLAVIDGAVRATLPDGTEARLPVHDALDRLGTPQTRRGRVRVGGATLIEPTVLSDDGPIAVSDEEIDRPQTAFLAEYDGDSPRWTVPIAALAQDATPVAASVDPARVVVVWQGRPAGTGPVGRLVDNTWTFVTAIDRATGAVAWRTTL